MNKYSIEIEEVLQRNVKVEAETEEEAIKKVKEMYENEKIILDYNDLESIKIKNQKIIISDGENQREFEKSAVSKIFVNDEI